MNARSLLAYPLSALLLVLAACGGSADAPPPPGTTPVVPVVPVPPTITQQPADVTVTVGQTASFTVAATGDATITYQWQKNGTAIAGATTTTYTTPATVLGDSGSTFRAVATNGAGSATSNNATLTVTASAPVLTITPQPASTTVAAGAAASFTVGGTCSSGTLNIQWQRFVGSVFTNLTGATAATYTIASAASTDNGAQFRAILDCSGQSSTPSSVATLTVTAPGGVTLTRLPIVGLRTQAPILNSTAIDRQADGSYVFATQNRLKRLSADLSTITVVAGTVSAGALDGPAATSSFNGPQGIAHDSAGNLYVTDAGNHTIRKVATDGTVSTLAGSAGVTGSTDGTGSAARFNTPYGIAIGPDGDLYVADNMNGVIRRVTSAGVVTTYAGSGSGFANGPAASAQFSQPRGIAIAGNGDLYVADFGNLRVRLVARSGTAAGNVSTFAGSGGAGTVDGIGTAAQIAFPAAMVLDGTTLLVGDEQRLLRTIDLTTATVTTLAGTANSVVANNDGAKGTGHFSEIFGIAPIPGGGYLVTDRFAVRRVSAAGAITTIATSAASDYSVEGNGVLSQLPLYMGPDGRTQQLVEPGKSVVVADAGTQIVRRIAPDGTVTLVAGLVVGPTPPLDGKGSDALFSRIAPIGRDAAGTLYLTDDYGVRKIATDGTVSFLAGSSTAFGFADGNGAAAKFSNLGGLAVTPAGVVFVGDGSRIRRIDAAGNVTTFAGTGTVGQVDGPVGSAQFQNPTNLTFAADGSLYVVDASVLRKISADGTQVTTVTGVTVTGGFAVDAAGTIYYYGVPGSSSTTGVYKRTIAGVDTLLVPQGPLSLGASPSVVSALGIRIYDTNQLLIQSQSDLLIATIP